MNMVPYQKISKYIHMIPFKLYVCLKSGVINTCELAYLNFLCEVQLNLVSRQLLQSLMV